MRAGLFPLLPPCPRGTDVGGRLQGGWRQGRHSRLCSPHPRLSAGCLRAPSALTHHLGCCKATTGWFERHRLLSLVGSCVLLWLRQTMKREMKRRTQPGHRIVKLAAKVIYSRALEVSSVGSSDSCFFFPCFRSFKKSQSKHTENAVNFLLPLVSFLRAAAGSPATPFHVRFPAGNEVHTQ